MNLDKSELKIGVAHELGCRLDDNLEATQKETTRFEGANQALQQVSKAIEGLLPHVDKDIEEGKFGLEAAADIKRYILRAAQVATNLSKVAENNRLIYSGRIQAMEMSVKIVKKFQEDEATKVANFKKAVSEGAIVEEVSGLTPAMGGPRPVTGIRPGMSIKEQRLAEAAAEAAAVVNGSSNGHANGSVQFESTPGIEQALTPTETPTPEAPKASSPKASYPKKAASKKSPKRA
jgi:hypothetical protein